MGGTAKAAIAAPISASHVRSFGPTAINGRAKSIAVFQSESIRSALLRWVLDQAEEGPELGPGSVLVDRAALVFSLGCNKGLMITSIQTQFGHERQRPMCL